jgi:hypothetical protein
MAGRGRENTFSADTGRALIARKKGFQPKSHTISAQEIIPPSTVGCLLHQQTSEHRVDPDTALLSAKIDN